MCNCYSYNLDNEDRETTEKDLERVIINPFSLYPVSIDYCIAHVIEALWKEGIDTGGSCCGHGIENPSVILRQQAHNTSTGEAQYYQAKRAYEIIQCHDGRIWDILGWQLNKL